MKMLDNRIIFSTNTWKKMGLTYQFEGKNFQVKSCDDLSDHRVKIAYSFDGEAGENILENRK